MSSSVDEASDRRGDGVEMVNIHALPTDMTEMDRKLAENDRLSSPNSREHPKTESTQVRNNTLCAKYAVG